MRIISEHEIKKLIEEKKSLHHNWQSLFKIKHKRRFLYSERKLTVIGEDNNTFKIVTRQNKTNVFDFSIILVYIDRSGNEYRLVRYNGKHSSHHTNRWEKANGIGNHTFQPEFHIHIATERYQKAGFDIDGYAEETTKYFNFNSALDSFLTDMHFIKPQDPQTSLFEGGDF